MHQFGCTIEARMSSSRLPGKVMKKVNGKSMLEYMVARVKQVPNINKIVIATTTNSQDNIIVQEATNLGVSIYRGSENDVMSRVLYAAEENNFDKFVALTGDCPLIDPNIISKIIYEFIPNNFDYISNAIIRSYPDGMDVQVLKTSSLRLSSQMTREPLHREHVTLHIYENPEIFRIKNVLAEDELFWPELGLTIDQIEDFELIKSIIENFAPKIDFSCLEIIDHLKKNPNLLKLNSSVERKGTQ
jgi:spore coat polysaccharide biosynthesis protein SpsF